MIPKPRKAGNPNKKSPAGQADRVVSYEPNAVRVAIEAQLCPFCGGGPYHMVALHTNKIHGIDQFELRRMAGLHRKASICSPERAQKSRDRALLPAEREYLERARVIGLEQQLADMNERRSQFAVEFADLGGSYEAVHEMAARHGITKDNMRRHLLAAGCDVPKGEPDSRIRPRRITHEERRKIIDAHEQGLSQKRIARLLGASRTRVRRVLRQAGLADVPHHHPR